MTTPSHSNELTSRRRLPAWAMSVILHAVGLLLLALLVRPVIQGAAGEPDRTVGIALVKQVNGEREYFSEESSSAASSTSDASAMTEEMALPTPADLSPNLQGALPSASEVIGGTPGSELPSVGELTEGSGPSSELGGGASTRVFGVEGKGYKFVYLFDRSASMDGFGGRPLAAAKRALLTSLNDLEDVHQFQIIFYNEAPRFFTVAEDTPRLYFGDDRSTAIAERFVRGMNASGGTRHMPALRMALQMRPDVIFFLTDADEPQLSRDELMQISRLNSNLSAIHAIEFGYGPSSGTDNFLRRLARENGGEHIYVDISTLPRP